MEAGYKQIYAIAGEGSNWSDLGPLELASRRSILETAHKNVEAGLGQAGLRLGHRRDLTLGYSADTRRVSPLFL